MPPLPVPPRRSGCEGPGDHRTQNTPGGSRGCFCVKRGQWSRCCQGIGDLRGQPVDPIEMPGKPVQRFCLCRVLQGVLQFQQDAQHLRRVKIPEGNIAPSLAALFRRQKVPETEPCLRGQGQLKRRNTKSPSFKTVLFPIYLQVLWDTIPALSNPTVVF